jgi:hypothetical protein
MPDPIIQFSKVVWRPRTVFFLAGFFLFLQNPGIAADTKPATEPAAPLKLLAVHAHRYQNFEQDRTRCEIFGEFQNTGTRKIRSFILETKLLDAHDKTVGSEDLVINPLSISREHPKGIEKAIDPKEYGYFNIDTRDCPADWLEGKIKYQLKTVQPE